MPFDSIATGRMLVIDPMATDAYVSAAPVVRPCRRMSKEPARLELVVFVMLVSA